MTAAIPVNVGEIAIVVETVPLAGIPLTWDRAWTALAAVAGEPNPFAEHWFMRPAIRNLDLSGHGRMLGVWRGRSLIGMLPVTIVPRYGRIRVQHVENWLHYHCFLGSPLVQAGCEAEFWEAVLATLDDADWAPNFLHLVGLDPMGPILTSLSRARRTDTVHRSERAMLRSALSPSAYYETNVRPKRRKEIRRLRARLDDLGVVAFERPAAGKQIDQWIADFLALEASGWKGREGSALNVSPKTRTFFRDVMTGAHQAGALDALSLSLDEKPIAMLINFITPPGSFAFKIAFDEDYARFSPGVLIKIENLELLDREDIEWTDSCAVENHPMINSLWAERRTIVRVTVPLRGRKRQAVFHGTRALETVAARLRGRL